MIQDSNFVREFNKFTKYEHQDEMNKIGCDIKIRLRDALDYLTGKRMGEYPQTFKLKRNHWFPLYFHLNNIEKMFYSSYDQQYKDRKSVV